jgi:hypothetical protein
MSSFRFKASRVVLSASDLSALRKVCAHGISEIQRRAKAQESLLDVPILSGDWPTAKATVVALLRGIEQGKLPLRVFEVDKNMAGTLCEEPLTDGQAKQRLQRIREIVLEQDRRAQLEEGHISSPEQYVPLPEDEA